MHLSIAKQLEKQSLIARRNNLELSLLQNSAAQRGLLNSPHFGGGLATVNAAEASLGLSNISNGTELMAVNAELAALNDSTSSRLNYMA